jgi:hypothetical protein
MKTVYLLYFWALLFSSCNYLPDLLKPTKKTIESASIEGSWELIIYKGVDPSGRIHYPYDKDVQGFAMFDKENKFSLQVYDATRPRLSNNDPFFCSDPEIRIAFLSERSCFGTYQMRGDSILFHIDAANLPNLSGEIEKRYFELRGDTLLLIAPSRRLNGVFLAEHSVWIKKGNSALKVKKPRWFRYVPRSSS